VKDFRIRARGTSFCIVTIVSASMTLFGIYAFSGGIPEAGLAQALFLTWPRNFMIALFSQWYVATPTVGRALSYIVAWRKMMDPVSGIPDALENSGRKDGGPDRI
jgi:predicted membrane protein